MDKYLLEILKEVSTIIIPGLGALTITDKTTGEIMFMPYLKHDDGKLAAHIAEKEGMDVNDAKNMIAKYVREITMTLDKGESYDMFEFGSFVKNGDDVDFEAWKGGSKAPEKEDVKEEKPAEKTPAVKKEAAPKEEAKPDKKAVAEKKEPAKKTTAKKATTKKEDDKKESTPAAEKAPVVVPVPEVKKEAPKAEAKPPKEEKAPEKKPEAPKEKELNIAEKEERAKNEVKLDQLKKEKEAKKEKKKRGVGFYLLIALIVIIVGGGTCVAIFFEDVKQHIPFLADDTTVVEDNDALEEMEEILGYDDSENTGEEGNEEGNEEANSDEVVEDEEAATEEPEEVQETAVVEETPVETKPSYDASGEKPFHIIAGAFSSEANANRLADKMRGLGYNVKVGPGRGMTLVSIKSYATRAEAEAGRSSVSSDAPKTWVYEWR